MIRVEYGDIGIFDKKYSRTILDINGCIMFNGKTDIRHGSRISVGEKGKLNFGNNFTITAESEIICFKKITF